MKVVVAVKLTPTPVQTAALRATLDAVNEAASWVSAVAFAQQVFGEFALRKVTYPQLKDRGLGAQAAQHVIKKVVDAYASLAATIRAGNLGKPGAQRRVRAEGKPIAFRGDAAQPFDDRCLSWQHEARRVSIWTVVGRVKDIGFVGHPEQLKVLAAHRKGESDLVCRDGQWFLLATCDIPEPETTEPAGWLGVDLGIVNIAATSDGKLHAGHKLNRYRRWMLRKRAELQAKATASAKRKLQARRRREARHQQHVNHRIAKSVVAEAQRTGRGIAIEDLGGIRERVRLRKPQRARLHSWAFAQLGVFLGYKARRAGVALVAVDPAYTSQTCPECGHVNKKNRPNQATFVCRACGVVAPHADIAAARVIASRGAGAWAAVNRARIPASGPGRCGPNRTRPGGGRRSHKTRTTEEPRHPSPVSSEPGR